MHNYEISFKLLQKLKKISKKDKLLCERVLKKIDEIINSDLEHYKNLKYDFKEIKRVHIGHFVLLFKLDKSAVLFVDFDHHDNVYKRK